MHDILDYGNIKTRLDEYGVIVDINTLEELKKTIEDFPDYIYLIDEAKIINENSLASKFKFLQAKDAIEHTFLIEHGIEDIQVDSISDIPKHVIQRIEILESTKTLGASHEDIQDSIIEIVDDAYENNSVDAIKELNHSTYFLEDEKEDPLELDDELTALLRAAEPLNEKKANSIQEIEDVIKEIDEKEENVSLREDRFEEKDVFTSLDNKNEEEVQDSELDALMNSFDIDDNNDISSDDMSALLSSLDDSVDDKNEEFETMFDSLDKDLKTEVLDTINETDVYESLNEIHENSITLSEGEDMASDFSSLDELNENDILNALNSNEAPRIVENSVSTSNESSNETIKVNLDNVSDISALLSKLLNNKTLEITIKVKD